MHWVPLVASLVAAAAIAPTTVRGLAAQGHVRENYRGAQVAFPAGIALVLSSLVALAVAAPLYQFVSLDTLQSYSGMVMIYVLGVAFLGLIDDLIGSAEAGPRGWRGHFGSLAAGRLSTGVLKAIGALALALLVAADPAASAGTYVLSVLVLVLATNVFNLLDLREVGMLGDTGSNVIGAVAGVWLILTLTTTLGLAIAAAVLALITLYGEFRSISAFVERTPGLRQLDLLGRSHA